MRDKYYRIIKLGRREKKLITKKERKRNR